MNQRFVEGEIARPVRLGKISRLPASYFIRGGIPKEVVVIIWASWCDSWMTQDLETGREWYFDDSKLEKL